MARLIAESAAAALQVPLERVLEIAISASTRYRRYSIPKGAGDQVRWIYHPDPELKGIQRWLARAVLCHLPVHSAAFAYRPKLSIAAHATAHVHARYLVRLDIRNFFPSITRTDLEKFLTSETTIKSLTSFQNTKLRTEDVNFILDICCRRERLTIGAPTSPSLSNAICHQLDARLEAILPVAIVRYTRYCDDLYFSCARPDVLYELPVLVSRELRQIEYPARLFLNRAKTRHMSPKRRREVTGLVITTDGKVSVGREEKRRLRAAVHNWNVLNKESRLSLAGTLAYLQDVEPDFLARLYARYGPARVDMARNPSKAPAASTKLPGLLTHA